MAIMYWSVNKLKYYSSSARHPWCIYWITSRYICEKLRTRIFNSQTSYTKIKKIKIKTNPRSQTPIQTTNIQNYRLPIGGLDTGVYNLL